MNHPVRHSAVFPPIVPPRPIGQYTYIAPGAVSYPYGFARPLLGGYGPGFVTPIGAMSGVSPYGPGFVRPIGAMSGVSPYGPGFVRPLGQAARNMNMGAGMAPQANMGMMQPQGNGAVLMQPPGAMDGAVMMDPSAMNGGAVLMDPSAMNGGVMMAASPMMAGGGMGGGMVLPGGDRGFMATPGRRMTATPASSLVSSMETAENSFISAAERASARNPQIRQEVFRGVTEIYHQTMPQIRQRAIEIQGSGLPPQQRQMMMQQLQQEGQALIVQRVDERFGPEGRSAMAAITEEAKSSGGFLNRIVKMFWDSDKGGPQIGRIIGTVAGVLGGGFLANSMGWGTMGTIVASLVGASLAGFLGSNLVDPKTSSLATPNFRGPAPALGRGPAPAAGVGAPGVGPAAPVITVNREDNNGRVRVAVADRQNPSYLRSYMGTYDEASGKLTIDSVQNGRNGQWQDLPARTELQNVTIQSSGVYITHNLNPQRMEFVRMSTDSALRPQAAPNAPAPSQEVVQAMANQPSVATVSYSGNEASSAPGPTPPGTIQPNIPGMGPR